MKKALSDRPEFCHEQDGAGNNALHFAVHSKSVAVVRHLISEAHVNLEKTNKDGHTPFLLAVKLQAMELAQALHELGANVRASTSTGSTAVHECAMTGNMDILRWLVEALGLDACGATTASSEIGSPLHSAVGFDHDEAMQYLLARGVPVDALDGNGIAALHIACMKGNTAAVQALLRAGANANVRASGTGVTPLHIAVDAGDLIAVQALVESGAVLYREASKDTPLDLALAKRTDREPLVALLRNLPLAAADGEDGQRAGAALDGGLARTADVFKQAANTAFLARDYDTAVSFYSEAIMLDPRNGVFYSNRAAAHFQRGNLAEALDDADRSVELRPEWGRAHFRRAATLMKMDRLDEAERAIEAGLAAEPDSFELLEARKSLAKARAAGAGGAAGASANSRAP